MFHNLIFGWVLKLLVVLSILNINYNVYKLNVINGIYVNIVKHFFPFCSLVLKKIMKKHFIFLNLFLRNNNYKDKQKQGEEKCINEKTKIRNKK